MRCFGEVSTAGTSLFVFFQCSKELESCRLYRALGKKQAVLMDSWVFRELRLEAGTDTHSETLESRLLER